MIPGLLQFPVSLQPIHYTSTSAKPFFLLKKTEQKTQPHPSTEMLYSLQKCIHPMHSLLPVMTAGPLGFCRSPNTTNAFKVPEEACTKHVTAYSISTVNHSNGASQPRD